MLRRFLSGVLIGISAAVVACAHAPPSTTAVMASESTPAARAVAGCYTVNYGGLGSPDRPGLPTLPLRVELTLQVDPRGLGPDQGAFYVVLGDGGQQSGALPLWTPIDASEDKILLLARGRHGTRFRLGSDENGFVERRATSHGDEIDVRYGIRLMRVACAPTRYP